MIAVLLASTGGLACFGDRNQGGGDGSVICEDGTGAPQITEGGDWGDRWIGYADLPAFKLDSGEPQPPINDLVPPQIEPPPPGWISDSANGIYYRRITSEEAEFNNWPWESLVVVAPAFVDEVTHGRTSAELVLPLAPHPYDPVDELLPTLAFDLQRRGSHNLATFIKVKVPLTGNRTRTFARPRFYFYVPAEIDGPGPFDQLVTVWGDDQGGVAARGITADREFDVRGPYQARAGSIILDVPPPVGNKVFLLTTGFGAPTSFVMSGPSERMLFASSGGALEVETAFTDFAAATPAVGADTQVGQCDDGLDNDGDGQADGCDFACVPHRDFDADAYDEVRQWEFRKEFGLFGDGVFCTQNQDAWPAILNSVAMEGSALLNQIEVPPEFGGSSGIRVGELNTIAGGPRPWFDMVACTTASCTRSFLA